MRKSKETILSFIRRRSIRVSLAVILAIILLLNVGFRFFFSAYLRADTETSTKDLVEHMETFLEDGVLSEEEQVAAQQMAITERAVIKVSQGGELVDLYLPTDSIGGMGMSMGRHNMAASRWLNSAFSDWHYEPVMVETAAGTVALEIGRPASTVQTQQAQRFIWIMNIMTVAIGALSIVAVYIGSLSMAKRISKPIDRMGFSATLMMNRHYDDVVYEAFGILELDELASQIKSLADRLSGQELVRRRMTGDIAHELRNPLAVLKSHVEAFQDGVFEVNEENLAAVTHEIERLGQLVDDLGELNDIEAMAVNGIKETIDLSEILAATVARYGNMAKGKGIDLTGSIEPGCIVRGMESQWNRLFGNLVQNALKYTDAGGKAAVSLAKSNESWVFRVQDTGIGIPEKDLPHIFDRFYRGDPSRNRETGGSGIGLSIVKSIADAYGCKIEVQSAVGEGTTVSLVIDEKSQA